MQRTKIEYLTHTWNPIAMRCTPVSDGCKNCWHLRMAKRLAVIFDNYSDMSHADWYTDAEKAIAYQGGDPYLNTKELSAPLRLRNPARIGVEFMGDLFHESITNEQIAAAFGVMAACPQHTFMILTKRFARMVKWTSTNAVPANVWLGVSVEDQATADKRIPWLLKTPAAKRFVSIEPMLGPVDLNKRECLIDKTRFKLTIGNYLDWVIAGAETGPGARPCDPDWLRSIRDQCAAAGVPFFLKQINARGDRELDGRMHEEIGEQ